MCFSFGQLSQPLEIVSSAIILRHAGNIESSLGNDGLIEINCCSQLLVSTFPRIEVDSHESLFCIVTPHLIPVYYEMHCKGSLILCLVYHDQRLSYTQC